MVKNALNKYLIILLFAIGLINMLSMNDYGITNGMTAFAQSNNQQDYLTQDNNSTKENITTTTALTSTSYDTFYAVGVISSLNFANNSILDIANSNKIVLSGHWSLFVNDGDLSFFEADFIAAPSDGGISHTHQIVNLLPADNKPIQLTSNGGISVNGTTDINLNGINVWENVKITISISKGSTIAIDINDIDTEYHFTSQPIYGTVDRLAF
jgi:hypothetical protein